MSAPQSDPIMRAVAEVVVAEEKLRVAADRELAAELERLREQLDSIDLAPIVPPELAEQVALAVRVLHESSPVAEPKPPPPPKVIRIERDANGSMVPIYGEP